MAGPRQKRTEQGMGAVRSSRPPRTSGVAFTEEPRSGTHGPSCPEPTREDPADDPRPLGVRDTVPAPPMVSADANKSGAQRRVTIDGFARAIQAPPASAPPASAPPASAPPASARGRYSSQPVEDEDVSPSAPPASQRSPMDTLRRTQRQPLRVDEVGATTIVATHDASRGSKPQLVDRKRIPDAPLSAREAFVLALIDGSLSVEDLVDAAGMPEREVTEILTRLVRLGIVSPL